MLKLFTLSIPNDGVVEEELNRFIHSHRVLAVERRFVTTRDGGTCLAVVVDYSAPGADDAVHGTNATPKATPVPTVDYRDALPPEQFAVFDRLRAARKVIAERESVKAFVVATNAQLAEIASRGAATLADLEKIAGFGAGRVKQYGKELLAAVNSSEESGVRSEELMPDAK